MNRSLRRILTALLAASAVPAGALDWGFDVHEVPVFLGGTSSVFIESLSSDLWLTSPLWGADFKADATGSGSLTFTDGTFALGNPTFDLTTLSLAGITAVDGGRAGVVAWTAGRHAETDLTGGWIVSSPWDGFNLGWQTGAMRTSAALGYSGLILKVNSKDSVSGADKADLSDSSVVFGPPRLAGIVGVAWNEVAFRQDIATEVLGQADLRSGTAAVHSGYWSFQVTGPLPGGVRQRTFASADAALSDGTADFGFLGGVELSATLPFLGSRIVTTGTTAWGTSESGFRTISGNGLADVVTLPAAHAGSVKVDWSVRPLAKTTLGTKVNGLWRTTSDPVAIPGFSATSTEAWLGSEVGVYGSWNPDQALSLGWVGGVFLPGAGFASGTGLSVLAVVTCALKL